MAKRRYHTPRYKASRATRRGAGMGFVYGMAISNAKGHNLKRRAFVTSVTTVVGASAGAGINKRKVSKMANKKGSWAKGNAPAQGSTPKRVSRPVEGTGKFKGSFKKGKRTAKRSGTS